MQVHSLFLVVAAATLDAHHDALTKAVQHCLNCKAEQSALKAHLEKHPSSALHETKTKVDEQVVEAKKAKKEAKKAYGKSFNETPGSEMSHRSPDRVVEAAKRGKGQVSSAITKAIADDPAAKTK